jgi:predicted RND superfamily exporter protein
MEIRKLPVKDTSLASFDENAGSGLERFIFGNRILILAFCAVMTVFLGFSARHLRLNASFEAVIPTHQPYIVNYEQNKNQLGGLGGNNINVIVQANNGSILDKNYLFTLQKINDEVFLLPGVDRAFMHSLWTPAVRWISVTSQGIDGGPVMPRDFVGDTATIQQLADNISLSGEVGKLVAPDYQSSVVQVPLLDIDENTGEPLDYGTLARKLNKIRQQFSGQHGVTVRVTGFAMVIGDLILAMKKIVAFFAVSVLIGIVMVYGYTRCVISTALVMSCSLLAVVWQLGILPLIGYQLDPYSVLVPFLVFAIGMSHGGQKMNGVMQDIGRGFHRLTAARRTFRRLFLAGLTALICDVVGFAVLLTVRIQAIQHLAIVASIGMAILIFTNLIVLPVLLSFTGVTPSAARRSLAATSGAQHDPNKHLVWWFLDLFTQRRYAAIAIGLAVVLGAGGLYVGRGLQVGDIAPGAPELKANSIYNRDNAYFVNHYATSSDVFVVMVKTPYQQCGQYDTLSAVDQLGQRLRRVPGVISTSSLADFERLMAVELNEGSYDWYDLSADQDQLNEPVDSAPYSMVNEDCDLILLTVYLKDHKAATLTSVVDTTKDFIAQTHMPGVTFQLAAGNGGIAAATNLVVKQASRLMLLEVYAAVILLSLVTFRSWRAVLTAVLPLVLTSILAQALMVALGIGVKVATLPVTALGVGIGVDYALYILSVTLANLRQGMALSEAYYEALLFTGKVVMLTGFTLAAAVATWAFSPIKFQADMGKLLAFMFLWNMFGALVLLPSLASFLLPRDLLRGAAAAPATVPAAQEG